MDLIAVLSTVILLVTTGTIMVALAAYAAVKVRDKRKPKLGRTESQDKPLSFQPEFLERYMPPERVTSNFPGEQSEFHPPAAR